MGRPNREDESVPPGETAPELGREEEASLQMILAMERASKIVDDYVRPRLLKLGLTLTEFSVLSVLYRRGPTPLGELSERILLTGASTTYTVKKLEERGLLQRRPRKEDHRVILGGITNTGRQLLDRILPLHAKALTEATRSISTKEKRAMTKLLRKML